MKFLRIDDDVYLLKVPFGAYWTGIVLVQGYQNILIDSGPSTEMVDNVLIPALAEIGMSPDDIHYLACTHTHGDHVGGHVRLLELCPSCIAVAPSPFKDKLLNPLAYGKIIRTRFPEHSPPVQSHLRGVEARLLLEDGDLLVGRLRLIHTPGHDTDSVCWLDTVSGTLITGDSVQGEGAAGSGLAFYQSLKDYRTSLMALMDTQAKRIVSGHDYAPHGYAIEGENEVRRYLELCLSVTERYDNHISHILREGDCDCATMARRVIAMENREEPTHIFLELHTITTHLKEAML